MGLDYVDIIIQIEEKFNIEISDKEAITVKTVGDLHTLVLRKISSYNPDACPTSIAFYQFRRTLCETHGYARETITPSSRLNDLFPAVNRKTIWANLKSELSLRLPTLSPSISAQIATTVCMMVILFSAIVLLMTNYFLWWFIPVALLLYIIITSVIYRLDYGELPGSIVTVGDLIHCIPYRIPRRDLCQEQTSYRVIKNVVSECLSIDEAEVTPEKRFIEDLGVG